LGGIFDESIALVFLPVSEVICFLAPKEVGAQAASVSKIAPKTPSKMKTSCTVKKWLEL